MTGPIEAAADQDLVQYLITRGVLVEVEVSAWDYDLADKSAPSKRLSSDTRLYRVVKP